MIRYKYLEKTQDIINNHLESKKMDQVANFQINQEKLQGIDEIGGD